MNNEYEKALAAIERANDLIKQIVESTENSILANREAIKESMEEEGLSFEKDLAKPLFEAKKNILKGVCDLELDLEEYEALESRSEYIEKSLEEKTMSDTIKNYNERIKERSEIKESFEEEDELER